MENKVLTSPWVSIYTRPYRILSAMLEMLRNIWLNYGWSHPALSSLIAAITGIAVWWVFGGLVALSIPRTADSQTPTPSISVTSINQSGGITAGIVNIYKSADSRDATLSLEESAQKKEGNDFVTSATLVLASPFPIGNLYVEAAGKAISEFSVRPQKTGAVMIGHSGKREDKAFTNLPNAAAGRYTLRIVSAQEQQFAITYRAE